MKRVLLACMLLPLVLATACAGRSPPAATHPAPSAAPVASVDAGPEMVSFDALAARGARAAPLMREVARTTAGTTKLEAKSADTCFRAAVAVRGSIEGRPDTAGDALVPPSGPICLRKGHSATLLAQGRAVIFAAP